MNWSKYVNPFEAGRPRCRSTRCRPAGPSPVAQVLLGLFLGAAALHLLAHLALWLAG